MATFRQFLDRLGSKNRALPIKTLRAAYERSESRNAGGGGIPQPTAAQRRQLPKSLIGQEDLIAGRFRMPVDKIRLNPDEVRFVPNRFGTTFAVKRTELDDLTPQQRTDIREFDRTTEAQGGRITQAHEALATQARTDRDTGARLLGELGQATTAGLGSVGSSGPSQAERQLGGQLGRAAAESSVAANTTSVARLNRLPSVVASEGQTALEAFQAQRRGDRRTILDEIRARNVERENAQLEFDLAQQQLGATLRGQSIGLLESQIGAQARLGTAGLQAEQRSLDRAQRAQAAANKLANQAEIARARGELARAKHLDNLAFKRRKLAADIDARQQKSAPKVSEGIKIARGLMYGNNAADSFFSVGETYGDLVTRGFSHSQANKILRAVIGRQTIDPNTDALVNKRGEFLQAGEGRPFTALPDPGKPPSSVFGRGPIFG